MEYKGYSIDKTRNGYRVSKKDNIEIHTHLSNKKPCYILIDNVLKKKIPKRCGLYFLESHIRLAEDEEYKIRLLEYLEVRKNKTKQRYYNSNHGFKGEC